MARRVNTGFVVGLGVALCLVAAGGIYLVWHSFKKRDPKVLLAQSEERSRAGDVKGAIGFMARAADAAAAARHGDADMLYVRLADMCLEASQKAVSREEAMGYYLSARGAWQRASTENPANQEVNKRLIAAEEREAELGILSWTMLEAAATDALKYQTAPTADLYLARARARMQIVGALNLRDMPMERLTDIQRDLARALELDAASPKGTALWCEALWLEAQVRDLRGAVVDARSLRAASQQYLWDFLGDHPGDIEATTTLAEHLSDLLGAQENYAAGAQAALARSPSQPTSSMVKAIEDAKRLAEDLQGQLQDLLIPACKADPGNERLVRLVQTIYLPRNPAVAQETIKDFMAVHPEDPQGFFWLGLGEQQLARGGVGDVDTARVRSAISAFGKAMNYTKAGGGIEAFKNDNLDFNCLYYIASAYLDLADREGVSTPAGKTDLDAGVKATERMRTSHRGAALLDLLDGRAELMKGNIPQAITILHRAESGLAAFPDRLPLVRVKLALAKANELTSPPMYGEAMRYLDDAVIMTRAPGNESIILEQASLRMQLGDFELAIQTLKSLLERDLPPSLRERATDILTITYKRAGREPEDTVQRSQSIPVLLQLAYIDLLTGDAGEAKTDADIRAARARRALDDLDAVFKRDPENVGARQIEAICYQQLGQKDKALEAISKGLAKSPEDRGLLMLKTQADNPNIGPMQLVRQFIDGAPEGYSKQVLLAQWYFQNKEPDKAIEALQAAEKAIDPDAADGRVKQSELTDRLFNATANLAVESADKPTKERYFALAETYLQRAQRMNLDGSDGRLYAGRLELMRTEGASGLQKVEQAVAQRPDYAPARTLLGKVYFQKERYDNALDEFRQSIRLMPNDVEAIRYAIRILMRNSNDQASRVEAVSLLAQGLRFAPRDATLNSFSDSLSDPGKAITQREKILISEPGNLENVRRLAELYMQVGDAKKAVDLLLRIAQTRKDDLNIADLLALAYSSNKQFDEAYNTYGPFVTSTDPAVRYRALLRQGAMCARAGQNQAANAGQNQKAEEAFKAAIAIEPPDSDEADRRLADLYWDTSRYPEAEKNYAGILVKSKPGEARNLVARRLVETEVRLRNFDEALRLLDQEILGKQPDDPQGLVLRASVRLAQRRADDALADLNRVLQQKPDYGDALYFRALANIMTLGDITGPRGAISDLLRARERDRSNLNLRMLLARAYRIAHRFAEAADEYAALTAQRPDAPEIQQEYVSFLMELEQIVVKLDPRSNDDLAMSIRNARPEQKLIALYSDLSKATDPNQQALGHLIYARLLTIRGNIRGDGGAQQEYEMLHQKLPDDAAISVAYLDSLLSTRNYEEAITVSGACLARAQQAAAGGKTADLSGFYAKRAAAYVGAKKNAEAVKDITELLNGRSNYHDAYFGAAVEAYGILPRETIDLMRSRFTANPNDQQSGVALAYLLVQAGRVPEAVDVVKTLRIPTSDNALKAQVLKVSATVLLEAKQYEQAAQSYTQFLEIVPQDIDVLNSLAYILADNLHRPKDAQPYALRAVRLLSTSQSPTVSFMSRANVYDTSGWVRYWNGDYDGAVQELTFSLLAKEQAVTYYHRARACVKAQKISAAADDLTSALRVAAPGDEIIPQVEALQKELGIK